MPIKCFVIMPFSKTKSHNEQYWTNHFELYLKPLIEKVGQFKAFRSEPLRGSISAQIILDLIKSDIVIADLTDYNPNVFWELGVRQSFKHCTVTIAENGTSIPFHLKQKSIVFYDSAHLDNEEFEKQFIKELKDCLVHPEEPDSPVLETITGRSTLYNLIHKEEIIRKIDALITELKEISTSLRNQKNFCWKKGIIFALL